MKSAALSLEKEYIDFAKMTPGEVSEWLNTLVTGLMKKKIDNRKSRSDERPEQ